MIYSDTDKQGRHGRSEQGEFCSYQAVGGKSPRDAEADRQHHKQRQQADAVNEREQQAHQQDSQHNCYSQIIVDSLLHLKDHRRRSGETTRGGGFLQRVFGRNDDRLCFVPVSGIDCQ